MNAFRSRLTLTGRRVAVLGAASSLLAGAVLTPAAQAQGVGTGLISTLTQFAATASSGQQEEVQQDETQEGPRLEVSETVLSAEGEHEITVTGSGFDATVLGTRPPLAGNPSGVYVVIGSFPDTWKPSEGVPLAARTVISQYWAVPLDAFESIGGPERGAIELTPEGGFTATFTVSKDLVGKATEDDDNPGNLGVYTYPGSGATHPDWELYQPITFDDGTSTIGGPGSLGSLTDFLS